MLPFNNIPKIETGHLSAIQKWGGKTSDYAKSGGARTENSWQVQVILAKIQQKWGGSSPPCPPVDKCPARVYYSNVLANQPPTPASLRDM